MRSTSFIDNLEAFQKKCIDEDIQKQGNNDTIHQSWTAGCIFNINKIPGQETFLYTSDGLLNLSKVALNYCNHAFIDDVTGFCSKHTNGKKWLGHHIYFRSINHQAAYFGGGIYTVDWTAHCAQKQFAFWLNLFNDFKKDSVIVGTYHTDWFVGYWNMIHECVNGMSTKQYQIWAWKKAFGIAMEIDEKIPISLCCTCSVHGCHGICRRFKAAPVTKSFCVDHFNAIRFQECIQNVVLYVSVMKTILYTDWMNIEGIISTVLTYDELVSRQNFDVKDLDERQNTPRREKLIMIGNEIEPKSSQIAAMLYNETMNHKNNARKKINIPLAFKHPEGQLKLHPNMYMQYTPSKNQIYLSWTKQSYPCAYNPTNNKLIRIQFEGKNPKLTWKYMWNTWLKWFGNYSIIIHKDLKQIASNQLAESGNRDWKVRLQLVDLFYLFFISLPCAVQDVDLFYLTYML